MQKAKQILTLFSILIALVLLALNYFSSDRSESKGYTMADGRKNPYPKGSPDSMRWAKANPLMKIEEPEPEPDGEDKIPETETSEE